MALVPPPADYYALWGHQVWIAPNAPDSWACVHPVRPPGHTTLYVIYELFPEDEDDDVLYVGITGNVRRRFKQHKATKAWWPNSELCRLECYDTLEDAADAELTRIAQLNPKHNVAGNAGRTRPRPVKGEPVEPLRKAACATCGHWVHVHPEDDEIDPYIQHSRCNFEIVKAYEMGRASMLADDAPYALMIRDRYAREVAH